MKCTLRKVNEGIVATIGTKTIDNNLKEGDNVCVDNRYLAVIKSVTPRGLFAEIEYTNDNGTIGSHSLMSGRCDLILASNIKDVGLELTFDLNKNVKIITKEDEPKMYQVQIDTLDFSKDYPYEIDNNKLIVKL